eukprot:c25288_g3_i1 orf=1-189(-)
MQEKMVQDKLVTKCGRHLDTWQNAIQPSKPWGKTTTKAFFICLTPCSKSLPLSEFHRGIQHSP